MIKDLVIAFWTGRGRTGVLLVVLYTLVLLGALRLSNHETRLQLQEHAVAADRPRIEEINALARQIANHEGREIERDKRLEEMRADIKSLLQQRRGAR